ncbi:acyl-CoA dehydrogenase family protein [Dactylosporangium aurantiacum]|uniref:Acyl-CoA dehydrogenase family protein n=1 Tax=Dactylosporangium aurantiacum TaxID=35754 RepID=A0A9Q9IC07_9ACTN|nr:acyl-CoA dehydrogenase family protein [Dactylosporangium aurantiacum]MDG6102761.1 acyl-CoA dehydrogenase family protein [Dactylosporangium aurantiacum]UWZ52996.1 acyl-CoA dehydrogenase family protein [Dactylosporangium aurantiacum]
MDFTLNDEQRAIREVTAEFVSREITPHAAAWDRAEHVDLGIVKKLAGLGILGITIPEEHGGSGGDHTTYCLVLEELGKGDSSVRGIVSVSLGLVSKSINGYGTPAQKAAWLPRLCAGDALGCFALTEPDTGSDAGALATRATRVDGGWRLDGAKMFITNGTWAQVALVFARTGGPGPKGVSAFLVPTGTPGLRVEEIHGKLGLRGQATAALTFDGVTVGDDALLGAEGEGFRIAMSALAKGRMSLAAGCVGIIQGCLEAAVDYAKQREQFGRPIASFQLVQQLIADISVEADAARLLTWRVADLIDRGLPFATESSTAKLYASEAAVRSANAALQVFGGYGYIDEYPVGKYLRDARVTTVYEGTSQIQKLIIGRALTGVNAFV